MEKSASHLVGQKILDLANIEAGVVIFGQFVAGRPVEWVIIWVGLAAFILLYAFGSWLIHQGRKT